jgi:signal recognition particle GTPase
MKRKKEKKKKKKAREKEANEKEKERKKEKEREREKVENEREREKEKERENEKERARDKVAKEAVKEEKLVGLDKFRVKAPAQLSVASTIFNTCSGDSDTPSSPSVKQILAARRDVASKSMKPLSPSSSSSTSSNRFASIPVTAVIQGAGSTPGPAPMSNPFKKPATASLTPASAPARASSPQKSSRDSADPVPVASQFAFAKASFEKTAGTAGVMLDRHCAAWHAA